MATGLPVVATSISGIPELVIDDQTGMLVTEGVGCRAQAACRAERSRRRAPARLAQRARSLVVERFNKDVESNRLATFFEAAMLKDETAPSLGDERSSRDRVGIVSK
jgi:glycosyltransferase involved in cell wall biosynthesis